MSSPASLNRREFLRVAGLAGGAVATAAAAPALTTRSPRRPVRGGTLRVGVTGGGSTDTSAPFLLTTNGDFSICDSTYEQLVRISPTGAPELFLADELSASKDATTWTVRVKKGIHFQNGKELQAEDVIYSLRAILDPRNHAAGQLAFAFIDPQRLRQIDKYTVQINMHFPFGNFLEMLAVPAYTPILPTDFNIHKPVGTGPFRIASFTPADHGELVKFEDYWQSGLPYLDRVELSYFTDETSQVNALLSGAVDAVNGLSIASMNTLRGAGRHILVADGGGYIPFTMRVDRAPFSDVRVREAMKYAVDRQQMRELVFGGLGTIGNDIFGIFAPEYDHEIPQRPHDPARAKSLLRAARAEGLSVSLETATIAQGAVQMAEVLQQQLSKINVKVNLRQLPVGTFFGPNYLSWNFAQDFWFYNFYLPQVSFQNLKSSPYNETHFNNSHYAKLYTEAASTTNKALRTEIAHEMQQIDYAEGGLIIPFFPPVIDGYASHVHGLTGSKSGISLNSFTFTDVWLS